MEPLPIERVLRLAMLHRPFMLAMLLVLLYSIYALSRSTLEYSYLFNPRHHSLLRNRIRRRWIALRMDFLDFPTCDCLRIVKPNRDRY